MVLPKSLPSHVLGGATTFANCCGTCLLLWCLGVRVGLYCQGLCLQTEGVTLVLGDILACLLVNALSQVMDVPIQRA